MATAADNTVTHAKIASGQTASGEVDLRGRMLLAVQTPSDFTGITLAFQVSDKKTADGGAYQDVKYLNTLAVTQLTLTSVSTSQHIVVAGSLLPQGIGNCFLKVVSGSAEAADRELILYTRPV